MGAEEFVSKLGLPRPYGQPHTDFMYNILFCDAPELFKPSPDAPRRDWDVVFDTNPDLDAVQKLADDTGAESRIRALAFNLLRKRGLLVRSKLLLGVIFEVPQKIGLDTLAAYGDGRVRYINQTGKLCVFEAQPRSVAEKCSVVLATAQPLVNAIGPWEKSRLPPPPQGKVRMTFLVSDGLYFGEAPYQALAGDPLGGPLLQAGVALLVAVTGAVKSNP
jgi:hypothetical protein